jgi:uncharacterized protein (TIGR03437 family)
VVPSYNFANVTATPLTVTQNTAADPSCQWTVQLNVDDQGGYGINILSTLFVGGADLTSQIPSIFGTTRLDALGGLQGTLCFGGVTTPSSETIEVDLNDGFTQQLTVSFAGPPASPGKITAAPATISLGAVSAAQPTQSTLAVNLSDKTQSWTATIFPANRTTSWLTLSQYSGIGSAQVMLTANGTGFEPGAYRATITLQSPNAAPQYINVPVMFVLGGSTTGTLITGVSNAASGKPIGSPGMLLSVYGSKLANATTTVSATPLAYSTAGVTATVNGLGAPILYASSNQINLQIPYAAGAGPAVLSVNNNGQVAGFAFQIAPSAPGVLADASGNVLPSPVVTRGTTLTLFFTGVGEVSPAIKTAFAPALNSTSASLPKPLLPLSVTVGGVAAFVQFAGIGTGLIGVAQVNLIVAASTPTGNQPVVVTVNGVPSPAVNVVVQP